MDNDAYGHVNNVVYYSWFDTAVNAYLIERGVLDVERSPTIGLVIETQCNYFDSLTFPQLVEAGLRVAKLGSSSVRYEIGLFAQGAPLTAARGISCMCTLIGARADPSAFRRNCERFWKRCGDRSSGNAISGDC